MTQIPKDVQEKIASSYPANTGNNYQNSMLRSAASFGYSISLQSITEQSQQIESLREIIKDREGKIAGLQASLNDIIKSWDSRCPEDIERKQNKEHGFHYWSPAASLVDSEPKFNAQQLLSQIK